MQIAEALRVNVHWLATDDGEIGLRDSHVEVGPDIKGRIPLINWIQGGDWTEIAEEFAYEDTEAWCDVTGKAFEGCFSRRVQATA